MFDKLKDLHSYHKIQTCGHALADFYVTCKICQLHIHDTTYYTVATLSEREFHVSE